ncbi:MAG: MarR family transcriptional regulator [Lachnospiraceae bacterium]|nr:MarR family transcriptional regulator [Lachnospiraceae bacterium]
MKREETVGFTIKTLNKIIVRKEMAAMEAAQLEQIPPIHGWVIGYLYDNREKEIFQKDLESTFCIARSTVTKIVKEMEKNGYIRRVAVDRDCRLKKLVLTKKGEESHRTVITNIQKIEENLCQGIDPSEKEIFFKVAGQLRDNLQKDCVNLNDCSCTFHNSEKTK